jgi:hypothetical protein
VVSVGGPPGGARPVHRLPVTVGDAHQVSHLHLSEAQGDITAADFPADLADAGGLADTPVAHDARGQVGSGNDFLQYSFHLFNVHEKYSISFARQQ